MVTLTDAERAHLNEMRALTTDASGQEILVGLTAEETEFYLRHGRDFISGRRRPDESDHYLELHEKHERARFAVLGAEMQLRNEKPARH